MDPRDMAATQAKDPIVQFLVCTRLYPVVINSSSSSSSHSPPTEPVQQNPLHFRVSGKAFQIKSLRKFIIQAPKDF